ncbi:SCO family protein [Agrobacterium sp. NPDC090273]|uniref:SCO family protein n=1 Tax=Agrobacterium sp. NPDC090273 TaxID=3363919 RepID=UPI00383B908D
MRNIRIALWAVVVVLGGVIGWLTLEMTKSREQMVEAPYGVPFELTAQNGQTITEKNFSGKPTALFFGFTHCPEVCPTTLFELNGWMEQVDPAGDKMQAYFISVDPERDTPEIMQQYVSNVSKRIIGVTGSPERIAETLKGYRIYAKKVPVDDKDPDGDYTMDHTASVILLDANSRFVSTIAYGENPDVAVEKLKNLLKS